MRLINLSNIAHRYGSAAVLLSGIFFGTVFFETESHALLPSGCTAVPTPSDITNEENQKLFYDFTTRIFYRFTAGESATPGTSTELNISLRYSVPPANDLNLYLYSAASDSTESIASTLGQTQGSELITLSSSNLDGDYCVEVNGVDSPSREYTLKWDDNDDPSYTVTPTVSGGNGTIDPNTVLNIIEGETATFTLNPTGAYYPLINNDTCGEGGSLLNDNGTYTYTTGPITSNCTVTASFTLTPDSFTATSEFDVGSVGHGDITPLSQLVSNGASTTFKVIPYAEYSASGTTDTCGEEGASIGSLNKATYTVPSVTHDGCIVIASFVSTTETYTVSSTTSGGNGSITFHIADPENAQPNTVVSGGTVTFILSADPGFYPSVDDNDCDTMGSDPIPNTTPNTYTYTTGAITGDCTITASFSLLPTYTVNATVDGDNGTIAPSEQIGVVSGTTTTFTVEPDAGYTATVTDTCGASGTLDGITYTTGEITGNCTVTASFSISADDPNPIITPMLFLLLLTDNEKNALPNN
ncbi:MAG: hypothetical protein D3924_01925 [Candidatus Electrothrix sp. AR4]|nr:hypothetical protein [Candidatus Electrothrix sp. AR4]